MEFQYEKFKRFRLDKGLTLRDMERLTGITFQNLSNIEKGSSPKADTLAKLAAGLGVDFNWFFEE